MDADEVLYRIKRKVIKIVILITLYKLGLDEILYWRHYGGGIPFKAIFFVLLGTSAFGFFLLGIDDIVIERIHNHNYIKYRIKCANEYLDFLKKDPCNFDYIFLKSTAKDDFFALISVFQYGSFEKCMIDISDELKKSIKDKFKSMLLNNYKRTVEAVELICVEPVEIIHDIQEKNDKVWFYMKYKAKDYLVDAFDGKPLAGCSRQRTFIQYWQFENTAPKIWRLVQISSLPVI
ncbi:hypothetical protein [uncultured Clostridium sp.]|uniref:hypothetical protein n=1 Tax=uncultured Clostridium sp. TaxID=59620 RepID=UPI0025DECC56|nr:hypothetical protein [uncultured Clostridium sp.]